jgi:DNA repair exonuclease SbcCD ATPase subunit
MNKLKEEFLELLEKDKEFRYAVAGYLGLSEILKRLDRLEEGQNKLFESQKRIWENIEKLWENQNRLWENQNKLWEELRELRITQARLAATLDRLTITIEEEGLDVIEKRLKDELGLDIKLNRIFVNEKEINIYGSFADICVIGEATIRLGKRLVEELEEEIKFLKEIKPELVKPKIIKVIYTDYATPEAIDLAKEYGIWVLNWKRDFTSRKILS